jgi:His-Xaa-Ser system radical SAM maturase HxsB
MSDSAGLAPFAFRRVGGRLVVTNELGDYSFVDDGAIDRLFSRALSAEERRRFDDLLITVDGDERWKLDFYRYRMQKRLRSIPNTLTYLILIPTLRCNLSCTYCQVSRAPLDAAGFDWTPELVSAFERFWGGLPSKKIKVEFQGGEPTVRADLLKTIMSICEGAGKNCEFVICTNLQNLSGDLQELLARDNVYVSTSIDGDSAAMARNRTGSEEQARRFFENLDFVLRTYGQDKVSALPTITDYRTQAPEDLIDFYRSLGFRSIFLRPVNYMGFARKAFAHEAHDANAWNTYYRRALEYIVAINQREYFEESYAAMAARKIVQIDRGGYVDLRSPAFFYRDFCVIDHDGRIYPSDEARMLSRINYADLAIGKLGGAIDWEKIRQLDWYNVNQVHPDCIHCAYKPYCGIDTIDDISRYGRVDVPKAATWFCQRHLFLYDLIFEKIAARDPDWLRTLTTWAGAQHPGRIAHEIFHD